MIKTKRNTNLVIIWLFILFPVAFVVILYSPSNSIDLSMFIVLLFATVISAILPLKIGEFSRLNIFWFANIILHVYGIGPMLFFYQIAVFIFLVNVSSVKSNITLFPSYSLNVLFGPLFSFGGLLVFHLFIDVTDVYYFIISSIVFYSFFQIYSFVMLLFEKKLKRQKLSLNKTFFYYEVVVSIFVIVLGSILYPLIESYGAFAIILGSIIYICAGLLLKKLDFTNQTSESLLKVMDVNNHLLDKQSQEDLTEMFLKKVAQVMNVDSIQFIYKTATHYVIVNEHLQRHFIRVEDSEFNFEQLFKIQEPTRYNYRFAWQNENLPFTSDETKSIVLIPIQIQEDEYAIVMLESSKRFAFDQNTVEICRLLSNSFTVALGRIMHLEAAIYKSERCALTGLHNYRYLTEQIESIEQQVASETLKCVSMVILDIDHFKRLNDTYGHENGNAILKEFAGKLGEMVDNQYHLARYGGEEFVLLLPNVTTDEARKMAENIRKAIELHEFKVKRIKGDTQLDVPVFITVSLGVANIPDHTNKVSELMILADKILYVGAKQVGRNRVAVFQKPPANRIEN